MDLLTTVWDFLNQDSPKGNSTQQGTALFTEDEQDLLTEDGITLFTEN